MDCLRKFVPSILKRKKKSGIKTPAGNEDVQLLTRLPPELQEMITRFLSQKDLFSCRLVSTNWKKVIDSLHRQDVILQDFLGFRGDLDIPMRNCTIVSIGDLDCRQFFLSSKTPDAVRLLGKMSELNFFELNYGWNNLTSMDLGWKTMALNSLFGQLGTISGSKNPEFLPQLKSLAVGVPTFTGAASEIIKNNLEFIFLQRFPNLESLKLKFVITTKPSELLTQIMIFICDHSKTLQDLHVEFITLSYRSDSNRLTIMKSDLSPSDFDFVYELPLHRLKYQYDRASRQFEDDNKYRENWMAFLSDKSTTKNKLFQIINEKVLNYPVRTFDYFDKLQDTAKYIVELNLSIFTPYSRSGTPNTRTSVDVSILDSCTLLEKLTLVKRGVYFVSVTPIEVVNLAQLPSSLKYLKIEGFAGASDDLNEMMSRLVNLKFLSFKQDGRGFINFVTGVDLRGLTKITKHPKLMNVNISLASYVQPRFYIRFYKKMLIQFKWTDITYSNDSNLITLSKIAMGRNVNCGI